MLKRMLFPAVGIFFGLVLAAHPITGQDEKPVSGGILNGKAIVLVRPDHPPAARAVNARGAVNVQIVIDETGNVSAAKAVSGHPLLRAASEKAALASKFSPALLSGKAVKVTGILVYNFNGGTTDGEGISAGVVNGRAKVLPKPEYTEELKKAGVEGTVTIEVVIDEEGNVSSARAVSGDSRLREITERAARQAKFEPSLLEGKAVKVRGVLIYNFTDSPDTSPLGKILNAPNAEFPPAAKSVEANGDVRVKVKIDEKGDVVSAEAVSGHALLRAASEKAALKIRFAPTLLNGEAVAVIRVLTYNFAGGEGKLVKNQ